MIWHFKNNGFRQNLLILVPVVAIVSCKLTTKKYADTISSIMVNSFFIVLTSSSFLLRISNDKIIFDDAGIAADQFFYERFYCFLQFNTLPERCESCKEKIQTLLSNILQKKSRIFRKNACNASKRTYWSSPN